MSIYEEKFFLPYQCRWINDNSRLKIIEESRQIGMSLATAYRYRLVKIHSCVDCQIDAWVSSRDDIQAKLFLDDCRKFSEILHFAARSIGQEVVQSDRKLVSFSISFLNNRQIHSISSNPNAQAGKCGTRVLHEFALHINPRQLYSIAYPGITWGGQLEIISTHRGTNNFFYKLVKDITENGNPKKFSHHKITLQDALEQGFLKRLQSKLDDSHPVK